MGMHLFALTRALVDIESITGNEAAVGRFLIDYLRPFVQAHGGSLEVMEVEADRFNVFASWGEPVVTLSTHLDTVPPFFTSREDDERIWGRGACDVKGVIAAMVKAAEGLLAEGVRGFGLLFVVGEERNSAGAYHASRNPRGSRYLINGEPTSNKLAAGSKGALRLELKATGRMAHSAYPELGDSAINKLLDALQAVRQIELPTDARLGPSTLNIGTITGGRAPNVIPDHAQAELFIRLVDGGESVRARLKEALAAHPVELHEVLCIPAMYFGQMPGFDTMVAAYTTDIPAFGGAWGKPYLLGPGTIHVAHTEQEHVPKRELEEAVILYQRLVRELLVEA